MRFDEFCAAWAMQLRNMVPRERMGQYLMNYLHDVKPQIYANLCATSEDPFYDDSKIASALAAIEDQWQ